MKGKMKTRQQQQKKRRKGQRAGSVGEMDEATEAEGKMVKTKRDKKMWGRHL